MASLFSKVAKFAQSPQGRAAIAKAKDAANDPKNRAKIDGLVNKVKAAGGSRATPSSPAAPQVRAEQVRPEQVQPEQVRPSPTDPDEFRRR